MGVEQNRAELQQLADEAGTFIARRDAAVLRARAAGMPWTEIGAILGVTPHGLRKSLKEHS
jgi:hypothetical protein